MQAPSLIRTPPPAAGAQSDDDDEPPKVTVIATATDEPVTKADLEEIATAALLAEIDAAEAARIARLASSTNDKGKGSSIPSRWIKAANSGYVNPMSFGFDKARLGAMPSRTMNRIRVQQHPRNFNKQCAAPGCNTQVFNLVHGRGACQNNEMRGLITDCSNQSVHITADAVGSGSLKLCTLLVNAGTKYGPQREDATIPAWALPGVPGRRGFPDKPDIVIIKNWSAGQPPPMNAKLTPGYAGPAVAFLIVEHRMTNDLYLQDACDVKRSIYVELVQKLQERGWEVELNEKVRDGTTWYAKRNHTAPAATPAAPPAAVDPDEHDDSDAEGSTSDEGDSSRDNSSSDDDTQDAPPSQQPSQPPPQTSRKPLNIIPLEEGELRLPIFTIIVGHTGCHLESNKDALLALGVAPAAINGLLLALSVNAVQRTHHCLAHYKHVCRTAATATPAPALAAGVG